MGTGRVAIPASVSGCLPPPAGYCPREKSSMTRALWAAVF